MYYVQHGELVIVMLGGGDKSTQQADIRQALAAGEILGGLTMTKRIKVS